MGQDTRELWTKRVERWKDSGLSARDFASEMGINPQTLSYWRWKLGKNAGKTPARRKRSGFVEVVADAAGSELPARTDPQLMSEPSMAEQPPEPLEIVLRDELRIRVPAHFDPEALRRVLATLGAC
jgi:transposase-like protein